MARIILFAQKPGAFPGLDLFPHRLKVRPHVSDPDREDVDEARLFGVFGEHRREHAKDNVPNPLGGAGVGQIRPETGTTA